MAEPPGAKPSRMVSPESETGELIVGIDVEKIFVKPPPDIARLAAPGPMMVSGSEIANSEPTKMVCPPTNVGANVIVSEVLIALLARLIASRKVKLPAE